MRSRILLRNLSRENEGLAVECSASNSDRTTGRTGLLYRKDRIPGRTGLKTGQNHRQDRNKYRTGPQAGQDHRQDRNKDRT